MVLVFLVTPKVRVFQYNLVFLQSHPHLLYWEIRRKAWSLINMPLRVNGICFCHWGSFGGNWAAGSLWRENSNQQGHVPNIFSSPDEAVTFNVDLMKSFFKPFHVEIKDMVSAINMKQLHWKNNWNWVLHGRQGAMFCINYKMTYLFPVSFLINVLYGKYLILCWCYTKGSGLRGSFPELRWSDSAAKLTMWKMGHFMKFIHFQNCSRNDAFILC